MAAITTQTQLRPRRTLNRLAWALAGVGVAGLGQYFFSLQQSLWDGVGFYIIGMVLFVMALRPRTPVDVKADPTLDVGMLAPGWQMYAGLWLMIVGGGGSVIGFALFGDEGALPRAWWLYFACLILMVGGVFIATREPIWRTVWGYYFPRRAVFWLLVGVVGIALFMRLFQFYELPFGIWFDEAEAGLRARLILESAQYRPIFYPLINVTGHQLMLYALALNWLGDTVHGIRFVSVMFGVGAVVFAYLFGRELYGPRFGLVLAFLVAASRWHTNFSRIAMTGVDTPFFEFVSLFFLVRLVKYTRLRDAVLGGMSIGFGLMFYSAFRLYLVAMVVFVILYVVIWWIRNGLSIQMGWRIWLPRAALAMMLGISVWLVVMPVARYAFDNPEEFMFRTQQVSIFTKRDQADLRQALWDTTSKHLLMFHYQGDKNGRHNLPGEPMLDPVTGVLMLLGLGLALSQLFRPANLFFLLLIPLGMVGGILTLDFEAPQSLRSIAVMPGVFYFAAYAVTALSYELQRTLTALPRSWVIGPGVVVAAGIFGFNAHTYFVRQANDFATWNAYSAPETITGLKMAELGPNYTFYLSPFLTNHPTTRFLAPDVTDQRYLVLPNALPIREVPERPVALFIHPDDIWVFEEAGRLYPNARFEIARGPSFDEDAVGPPSVYFVLLDPGDIASIQGVELHYWEAEWPLNRDEAELLRARRADEINVNWPQDALLGDDYIAEWTAILHLPRHGPYGFRVEAPGRVTVEIDGNEVASGEGSQTFGLPLAEGAHRLRVVAAAGDGNVSLWWQPPGQREDVVPSWALYTPPVTNHGLLGTYYPNASWTGQPAFERIDTFLDTYFHLVPLNRPYSVEWVGRLDAPISGQYRLGLRSVPQGAELYLNDALLVQTAVPDSYALEDITLEAGLHDIRIRFSDTVDRSRIHLGWVRPDGGFEIIPPENLWPPMGSYPEPNRPIDEAIEIMPLELVHVASLGGPGSGGGQFLEPRDVAVLSSGNLVVADTGNQRVQILDADGTNLASIVGDEEPFLEPLAVVVNSRDEILVLDTQRQWVYRFDSAGNFIDKFAGPAAQLFFPRGMSLLNNDDIAVADTGRSRVVLFNDDGLMTGVIGALGDGPGQFNEPTSVLLDSQNTYFVAEAYNSRIQRVDALGNHLSQWLIPETFALNGPHLAFGPDDTMFATNAQSRSLLRYAPDGNLLGQWQTIDGVTFAAPVGIYHHPPTNRLYVTDVLLHQVHIFAVRAE